MSGSFTFKQPPSVWGLYPRILVAQKPPHVRSGASVPRIEARLVGARVDLGHLERYRSLCGFRSTAPLPITYPHVLAGGLHLAVLSSNRFPVRLLGLVHVSNRIEQHRPLVPEDSGDLVVWIEGHRDTDRGQEFDLHTEWRVEDEPVWSEVCTFLARRRRSATAKGEGGESRDARPPLADVAPEDGAAADVALRVMSFRAPAGLGREYGLISGDINPIHLFDLTARAFGFKGAIAHGMWSMARCAAELPERLYAGACRLETAFKLPILLPAWCMLESWDDDGGVGFTLRDSLGERPHLAGSLRPIR